MRTSGSAPAAERLSAAALLEHGRAWPESAEVIARMLDLLSGGGDPFQRSRVDPGHFTASAFVLCPERRRVLLIHHQKLGRWLQPGGHVEASDADLVCAARREVVEETGVIAGPQLGSGIFDVDVHRIPETPRDAAHLHFDVRYAFIAAGAELAASPEVLGACWVELGAVAELTDEHSVLRCTERLRTLSE